VPDGSAYYLRSRDRSAPGSSLANLRAWLRGQAED
jgi:hypothetical protein